MGCYVSRSILAMRMVESPQGLAEAGMVRKDHCHGS